MCLLPTFSVLEVVRKRLNSVVVSIFVYVYSAWVRCCRNCVHFHLLCLMHFRLTLVAGPCKYFYIFTYICVGLCVCVWIGFLAALWFSDHYPCERLCNVHAYNIYVCKIHNIYQYKRTQSHCMCHCPWKYIIQKWKNFIWMSGWLAEMQLHPCHDVFKLNSLCNNVLM